MARPTYERNKNNAHAHYENTPAKHQIGKLGEAGVEEWLRRAGVEVDAVFRDLDREGECDLVVAGVRIEVKSWTAEYWEPWGRCATPAQIPWIADKADLILWITVARANDRATIRVQGWSKPAEVGTYSPTYTGPKWKPIRNRQVPLDRMHSPSELLAAIKSVP